MEFRELISARRSIRKFNASIDHDTLAKILSQAQKAPSWKNQQTSRCYVVETPEALEDFSSAVLPSFNRNSSENAVLIVTTYVKNVVGFNGSTPVNEIGNGWGAYDLGLHDAYLILAASDRGYDTLIMGIRDGEAIREKLSIPEEEEIVSVIAVGRRAGDVALRPRKEFDQVVKFF